MPGPSRSGSSARGLRKEIDAFDLLGLRDQQRHFVLNRSDARVGLSQVDIEQTVGLPVSVTIPSSRSIPTAMNQGSPVLESEPRSTIGRSFGELVSRFAVETPSMRTLQPAGGLFRRGKETR